MAPDTGRRRAPRDAWLVRLSRDAHLPARDLGGKGARLQWLIERGFDVPDTWVIPTAGFDRALSKLPPACEPRSLLRAASTRAVYARAAEVREHILAASLPEGLEEELRTLTERFAKQAPWGFAVRSSATAEDGALVSMAGLAETVLGVHGAEALVEAVRTVWASIASGRALVYLASHGVRDFQMAVVIQPLVQAVAAGVMFTDDWQEPGTRIINAGFGLGAPVVDGAVTPDVIRLDSRGEVLSETIAEKTSATVVVDQALTQVSVERSRKASLAPKNIAALGRIAMELEGHDRIAWDVEFACDQEKTWVLQARPVTGRGFPDGGDANTIWSNVNVGEALPGVATPLTWSIAGAFSDIGFRRAFATLGCHVPKGAKLVGNVHGRVYLNLSEFMKIAGQVPGLDPRVWFDVGGGDLSDDLLAVPKNRSRVGFVVRLPKTMSHLVREQAGLSRDVERFVAEVSRAERAHRALDLAIVPDDGLAKRFRDMQALLERTGTMMLTCASTAFGSHVVLRAALQRLGYKDAEARAQELTTGIADLESAKPAVGLLRLAEVFRATPEILNRDLGSLDDLPEGEAKAAFTEFLTAFGDRGPREAELSTPRWKDDPAPLFVLLRTALLRPAASEPPERHAPVPSLTEKLAAYPMLHRAVLHPLTQRARVASRLREEMRTWVTRVLGMIRDAALDANRRLLRLSPELEAEEALSTVPSVFFLHVDELVSVLKTSRSDFSLLVRARRAEFVRDNARPDPPRMFKGVPPRVQRAPSGVHFQGLGAARGVVEGVARVLRSSAEMSEFKLGEILVTRTTDVGWTPLFPLAVAVVTELGGPLSHAAIVARELSVPCVVNVEGATVAIRTGDRLRIDGDRGIVEKVEGET